MKFEMALALGYLKHANNLIIFAAIYPVKWELVFWKILLPEEPK